MSGLVDVLCVVLVRLCAGRHAIVRIQFWSGESEAVIARQICAAAWSYFWREEA